MCTRACFGADQATTLATGLLWLQIRRPRAPPDPLTGPLEILVSWMKKEAKKLGLRLLGINAT